MADIRKRDKSKEKINKENDTSPESDKTKDLSRQSSGPRRTIPLRVLSRTVAIFSLLIVVYFSSKNDKIKPFAKQSELLPGKGQVVDCSPQYARELDLYEGCAPKVCKRFVTDKVASVREADELLEIAKKGLKLGGSSGCASILDLHSGALSMGQHFVDIYMKSDANLFTEQDFNVYRVVKEKIKYSVAHNFGVSPDKIYLTHPTFFSKLTSKKAVSVHDEYWHPHVDKETYKSFHYTTLLYLNDYNIDFKGGRFFFVDEKFNRTVEPRKGRVSMFTSGKENLHYVEKVTAGDRYAMTISFTCDKLYAIEDPSTNKYIK